MIGTSKTLLLAMNERRTNVKEVCSTYVPLYNYIQPEVCLLENIRLFPRYRKGCAAQMGHPTPTLAFGKIEAYDTVNAHKV